MAVSGKLVVREYFTIFRGIVSQNIDQRHQLNPKSAIYIWRGHKIESAIDVNVLYALQDPVLYPGENKLPRIENA